MFKSLAELCGTIGYFLPNAQINIDNEREVVLFTNYHIAEGDPEGKVLIPSAEWWEEKHRNEFNGPDCSNCMDDCIECAESCAEVVEDE
jgi:hypothetical protein